MVDFEIRETVTQTQRAVTILHQESQKFKGKFRISQL